MFAIDSLLVKIALIGIIGIGAQWIAWRTGKPAIALMLVAGILAGPVLGLIDPVRDFGGSAATDHRLGIARAGLYRDADRKAGGTSGATETDLRLKRLDDAIENGIADVDDPDLKDRIATPKARRDQAKNDAERVTASLGTAGGGRCWPGPILGSKSNLLQAPIAGAAETRLRAVPSLVPKWCTRLDSNQWPPD